MLDGRYGNKFFHRHGGGDISGGRDIHGLVADTDARRRRRTVATRSVSSTRTTMGVAR